MHIFSSTPIIKILRTQGPFKSPLASWLFFIPDIYFMSSLSKRQTISLFCGLKKKLCIAKTYFYLYDKTLSLKLCTCRQFGVSFGHWWQSKADLILEINLNWRRSKMGGGGWGGGVAIKDRLSESVANLLLLSAFFLDWADESAAWMGSLMFNKSKTFFF